MADNRANIELSKLYEEVKSSWLIVLAVILVFVTIGVAYIVAAGKWYRAETLISPVHSDSQTMGSQFGGIASLVGLNLGGDGMTDAIATLRSKDFARIFIEENDLMPILFSDEWSEDDESWISDDPEEWPDLRDGIKKFHDKVLDIIEYRDSGLVTIAMTWTSPDLASSWANQFIERLNQSMRERAMVDAQRNLSFLRNELEGTQIIALQQTIGGLLEIELQTLMWARGREEYSFRIIDKAFPPNRPDRPSPILVILLLAGMGFASGC